MSGRMLDEASNMQNMQNMHIPYVAAVVTKDNKR